MTRKDLGPGLNWRQAIKLLGCSRSYFYRLVEEGSFPNAFRLGVKGVRVPQADVEAFVEKRKIG